jgi:hypothetical protein
MADSSKTGNSNCRCLDLAASPPNSPGPPGILIVAGREKSLSLYTGPTRTINELFQTPTTMFPFNRKPITPNIFFSSQLFFQARASRMRWARDSLKAIAHSSQESFISAAA